MGFAVAVMLTAGMATFTPTTVQAAPAPAPAQASAPAATARPAASAPVKPSGKRSAHAVCPTVVPKGYARCLAMVMETNGVVPDIATPTGLGPADIRSAYSLPANGGAGAVIGIVDAYDDPNAAADLAVYRSTYGLPALTPGQFTKVDQRGGTTYPTPDAGWAGEITLDLDAVTSVAPNAKIILVEADSNYIDDLGASVNEAVALGAKFVSNSYSGAEDPTLLAEEAEYYTHPGVAVVAASGDDGYGVGFPAASTYVTAVGGTTLVKDTSARGWSESVWNNTYGAPGSGCSADFAKPSFQKDTGCPKRTVADVSAVADPDTGLAVYDTYQAPGWAQYGGTSLSSPLIAATYALGGNPAPNSFPNSYPYAHPGSLNDVTSGNDGTCSPTYLCTAGPGYDGPTGLGTPKGDVAFSSGPHGDIVGTITDSATGKPIAGATVSVTNGSATTAANGTYILDVATGTYSVSVSAYGYHTLTKTGVAVAANKSVTINATLVKQPTHAITGRVTDGSGHGYALYAQISVAGVPGGPVYSNPYSGQYSLSLPAGSTYTLTVNSLYPGYLTSTSTVTVGSTDLVHNVALKVDPSVDTIPGYKVTETGSVQGFDGTSAPPGWSVLDNADPGWTFQDLDNRGNLTGGSGGFAIVDSDYDGLGLTQDSYLISPTFNLSAATAPTLEFDTDFDPYSNSDGVVDLSVDGGTTWSTIWDANDSQVTGHIRVSLPASAISSKVKVRFHYTGSFAFYWEVDNVFVGNRTITPVPGGLVAGRVSDNNTFKAIDGAKVVNASGTVTATTGPTGDPAIPNGFYWLFSPDLGVQAFTASKGGYGSSTRTLTVIANGVVHEDFALKAGLITATPTSISKTLAWGSTASSTVTLKNSGRLPATVKIGEQSGGFVLQAKGGAPLSVVRATVYSGSAKKESKIAQQAFPRPAVGPSADAWQPAADYPEPIQDNAAAVNAGVLYSTDGFDGTEDVSDLYSYSATAGSWTKLASPTDTREQPAAAFIGGKLIVTGGWGSSGDPDGNTEIYDPNTDSWTTGATNSDAYSAAGRAVLNNKLYVIGGCSSNSCGYTDVNVYDPSSDTWSTAAAYPEAISWESCGAISGKIYCAGGLDGETSITHSYVYDPGADSWSPVADLPADLWGSYYTAANGQLLVAGGVVDDSSSITNEGFSFDPTTGAWTPLPNMNAPLFRGAGAVGFYEVGGGDGVQGDLPTSSVQVLPGYDVGGDVDVPWLTENPSQVTIAAGASSTFTVTFDASDPSIVQPGTYTAGIDLQTDTPYTTPTIGITMVVKPPSTWGKIAGTVTYKDATGTSVPIPGATVEIDSWAASYTLTTAADGSYALWLDKRNDPLTMIVAKDGYKPQTATVSITAGTTTTKNWVLLKR